MNKLPSFLFAMLSLFLCSRTLGQNHESRVLGSFDEVKVFGGIHAILEEGEEERVEVYIKSGDFEDVITSLKGKTLKVSLGIDKYIKEDDIQVRIYYVKLREVSASGGAHIEVSERLSGDKLSLSAQSGGELEVEIETNTVDLSAGQGGRLFVSGKTISQDSNVNTGGEIHAFDLDCQETFVKLSAGGIAEVVAKEKIEASVSMGGSIIYTGDPDIESTSTSLGGNITSRR